MNERNEHKRMNERTIDNKRNDILLSFCRAKNQNYKVKFRIFDVASKYK